MQYAHGIRSPATSLVYESDLSYRYLTRDRPPILASACVPYRPPAERRQAREDTNDRRKVPQVQEVGRSGGHQRCTHQGMHTVRRIYINDVDVL